MALRRERLERLGTCPRRTGHSGLEGESLPYADAITGRLSVVEVRLRSDEVIMSDMGGLMSDLYEHLGEIW